MKQRPILFNASMVRAILDGTKTQTRRVVKLWQGAETSNRPVPADVAYLPDFTCYRSTCPYGKIGDQLWVREAFSHFEGNENFKPGCQPYYRADGECIELRPWRPSIHMPRWASRITLEITGVRVEKLQDISAQDCWAEGINEIREAGDEFGDLRGSVIHDYRTLWESINGPESWTDNPWVWVVKFKRIT